MTLERWRYGDPLAILIAAENGTCKGCQYAAVAFDRRYCDKGKKYGKKCGQYSEVTINKGKP